MPRYYFHIRQGDVFEEDLEGVEFASLDLARQEAVAAAREIMAERVRTGVMEDRDVFEITTEEGSIVATVPFRMVLPTT